MKVIIGPYISRWTSNIHRHWIEWRYKEYHWNVSDDREDRWDHLVDKLDDALQWVYNHTINLYLDRKRRTIKVKIDKWDTWGMDETLAHIILPMLKQLRDTKHGAPYVDDEDVPEHLRSTSAPELTDDEKNTGSPDQNHFKRWDWVLDEMIFAFEKLSDENWESEFYSGEVDWKFEKDDETGLSRMNYGPNHTFKVDREGMKKVQDRINNGLRLFGRYYQALWD